MRRPGNDMRISDGLEMLELEMKLGGHSMMIHPVIINDKDDWTLIDTGMLGLATDIRLSNLDRRFKYAKT